MQFNFIICGSIYIREETLNQYKEAHQIFIEEVQTTETHKLRIRLQTLIDGSCIHEEFIFNRWDKLITEDGKTTYSIPGQSGCVYKGSLLSLNTIRHFVDTVYKIKCYTTKNEEKIYNSEEELLIDCILNNLSIACDQTIPMITHEMYKVYTQAFGILTILSENFHKTVQEIVESLVENVTE